MSEPERYDTSSIEERISVFESRFTELTTRYAEFAEVLKQLNTRIDDHLVHGEEMIELARDEQEGADQKKRSRRSFFQTESRPNQCQNTGCY